MVLKRRQTASCLFKNNIHYIARWAHCLQLCIYYLTFPDVLGIYYSTFKQRHNSREIRTQIQIYIRFTAAGAIEFEPLNTTISVI